MECSFIYFESHSIEAARSERYIPFGLFMLYQS